MIGIYKITNKINGKIYIGQSININKRINEHFWQSFNQKDVSFNSILHQAIRKYGKENFSWEVLQECDVKEIDSLEKNILNNMIVFLQKDIIFYLEDKKIELFQYYVQFVKNLFLKKV